MHDWPVEPTAGNQESGSGERNPHGASRDFSRQEVAVREICDSDSGYCRQGRACMLIFSLSFSLFYKDTLRRS